MTSRSPTITYPDWLDNEHAEQMLFTESLETDDLSVEQLADEVGIAPARIAAVIGDIRPVDGELDLRLTRYFGLSEGFFQRLQTATTSSKPSAN